MKANRQNPENLALPPQHQPRLKNLEVKSSRLQNVIPGDPDENSTLLNQYSSRNTVEIKSNQVILSVQSSLILGGSDSDLSSDYLEKDQVSIFAEQIIIGDDFKAKKAVIFANTLTFLGNSRFNFSGQNGLDSNIPLSDRQSYNGTDGGSLYMYLESPTETPTQGYIPVYASGGNGGAGRKNDIDHSVGNGGDGGKGGNVTIRTVCPYKKTADSISDILKLDPKSGDFLSVIKELIKSSADYIKEYLSDIDSYLKTSDSPDSDILKKKLQDAADTLSLAVTKYTSTQQAFIEIAGGEGGILTVPDPDHHEGKPGVNGTIDLRIYDSVPKLISDFILLPVHPAQCIMLLNQAKLQYILLNYNDEKMLTTQIKDLTVWLNRLDQRTKIFVDVKDTDSISQYYKAHESEFGARNSIATLQRINKEVQGYMYNLTKGLDAYGYAFNYVPIKAMASGVPSIQDINSMETLLKAFQEMEQYYVTYLKDLRNSDNFKKVIKNIETSLKDNNSDIQVTIPILWDNLKDIGLQIDSYKQRLETKKKLLTQLVEKYRDDIKNKVDVFFDIDITSFLEAASTIAFAPESPAMWVAEGAKVLQTNLTTISDGHGNRVNTDYVVHEISKIGNNLNSISEGYTKRPDGTIMLDDPGANKLLGEQQEIENLLDNFYKKCQDIAEELSNSLKDYISTVIERNNLVIEYNACVGLLQQKYQTQQSNQDKLTELRDQALGQDPDLPSNAAFALEAYNVTQNDIILILNFASRIYRFWTLDPNYLCTINGSDGVCPSSLNYNALQKTYLDFYSTTLLKTISSNPVNSTFTGDIRNGVAAQIFIYKRDYYEDIKFGATVEIKATKAGEEGPFSSMANIRINNVRVYLKGAKMKDGHEQESIRIDLTHGREDTFR